MRVDVNTTKVTLNDALREMVHRMVLLAVGRFRPVVDTVRVAIADESEDGAAAGRYRVALRLEGWRRLVIVEHDHALADALARAADRARRALDRERSRASLSQPHTSLAGPAKRIPPAGPGGVAATAD
jgi:ribosome-associated translation inhibitor RaiA